MCAASHTYQFPRPAIAVDCVVFGYSPEGLHVLLLKRGVEPFAGKWVLPGGFLHQGESGDEALKRLLLEKAGIQKIWAEQLYTFTNPARDPREQIISIAYFALVKSMDIEPVAGRDTVEAQWKLVQSRIALGFDHAEILQTALDRLAAKLRWQPVGFELLPPKFTLSELQHLYETILRKSIDKRNFRKKILAMNLLDACDEQVTAGSGRPAQLYRFNAKKYKELSRQGFHFEL
ncbi:MAG: NUDIX hydrolase [Bacteroidia bacterium]|jgi:8-oxo-dGTP diphosphatase|nr:NUDIX hydrolase [Bacteroidia bacterium]